MSMFHELMMKKKGMPSRYQEVEYIESTGTQFINTGINKLSQNAKVVLDCLWVARLSPDTFFGAYNYIGGVHQSLMIGHNSSGNTTTLQCSFGAMNYIDNNFSNFNQRNVFKIENQKFYINDELTHTFNEADFYTTGDILLFSASFNGSNASNRSTLKVYSCEIYDNGKKLRNFIPVYDTETQKYGMWESVQGKFYGNDGTGDFKGSIVGYTVVGSPTITDGVVSGFSGSDYLATGKYLSADKIEISIPFSFDTLNWNDIFWGRGNQQLNQLYEVTSGSLMRLYFQQGFAGYIDVARVYINTNYRIITTLTYDDFAYKIINEDTNTIVVEGVKERTTKAKPYLDNSLFGRSAPNSKIVIKDTTIKADGKLWFNGQPS